MMRGKKETGRITTSVLFLLTWIHCLPSTRASQELEALTPYGKEQNDILIKKMNPANSFEVHLNVPFKFTGRIYDKIYLTKNGVITFGGAHPKNQQTTSWDNIPQRFPLPTAHPLIAAYWTNPQITEDGDLWFQQTMDIKKLNLIKHKVQCLYPQNKDLVAKWAFIATWENVNSSEDSQMLSNTFQLVLVNIDDYSYLLFQYANLTWNSWMSVNGTTKNSLQSAVAGYNGGDGIGYSMLPGSTSKDILKLQNDSNVNVPSLWIFRIDLSQDVCVEKGLALMLLLVCLLSILTGITMGLLLAWCCCKWKHKLNDYEDLDSEKTPDSEKQKSSGDSESNEDLFILPKDTVPVMYTSQAGVDPQHHSEENPPRKIIILKKHH